MCLCGDPFCPACGDPAAEYVAELIFFLVGDLSEDIAPNPEALTTAIFDKVRVFPGRLYEDMQFAGRDVVRRYREQKR